MKLTTDIKVPFISTQGQNDYVFDMHIANKHNAKLLADFTASMTNYIKQSQTNEFAITPVDVDGIYNDDSDLIIVEKVGLVYTVTTSYAKTFSGALCYDENGVLTTSVISISFPQVNNADDRTKIVITLSAAITTNHRIILL